MTNYKIKNNAIKNNAIKNNAIELTKEQLRIFNYHFCKDHNFNRKDIEKAKRMFKPEYESDLQKYKEGKLKVKSVQYMSV